MATCGICKLECVPGRIIARGLVVVRTSPNRDYSAALDEDIRLRAVVHALEDVRDGDPIDVLAYETYRPFQRQGADGKAQHTAAHGRLVSMSVGAIVGWGLAIGARTVPINPDEPKRILRAHSKAAVSQVLEAKIEGLTELLDA